MERWLKSFRVALCWGMMASGTGLCIAAPAQQAQTTESAQTAQPAGTARRAGTVMAETGKLKQQESQAQVDSVIQDEPAHRSKVCTIQKEPTTISCVFAVTHAVGDSCTCKVGNSVREGRFLDQ